MHNIPNLLARNAGQLVDGSSAVQRKFGQSLLHTLAVEQLMGLLRYAYEIRVAKQAKVALRRCAWIVDDLVSHGRSISFSTIFGQPQKLTGGS